MTKLEMEEMTLLLLGETDTTNTYYNTSNSTEVLDQINFSNLRVAAECECLVSWKTFDTVASTLSYSLPLDFLQMKDLILSVSTSNHKPLIKLSHDQFQQIAGANYTSEGQPEYYLVEFGAVSKVANSPPGDFWLYPVPDSVYTANVIHYYQKPSILSADADVSELPHALHQAVCFYAAKVLAYKKGDHRLANQMQRDYTESMFEMSKMLNHRDRTGSQYMKQVYGTHRGSGLPGRRRVF